jgi:hypothetical protein
MRKKQGVAVRQKRFTEAIKKPCRASQQAAPPDDDKAQRELHA